MQTEDEQKILQAILALLERVEQVDERIGALEQRIKDAEHNVYDVVTQFNGVLERMDALEAKVTHRATGRKPRSYDMWDKVMALHRNGMAPKEIAKTWKIPASTVYSYMRMTEEEVRQLPGAPETGEDES